MKGGHRAYHEVGNGQHHEAYRQYAVAGHQRLLRDGPCRKADAQSGYQQEGMDGLESEKSTTRR